MGLADSEPDMSHDGCAAYDRGSRNCSEHEGFAFDDREACETGTVVQRTGHKKSFPNPLTIDTNKQDNSRGGFYHD